MIVLAEKNSTTATCVRKKHTQEIMMFIKEYELFSCMWGSERSAINFHIVPYSKFKARMQTTHEKNKCVTEFTVAIGRKKYSFNIHPVAKPVMQTKRNVLVDIAHVIVKQFIADVEAAAMTVDIPIPPLVTIPTCKHENEAPLAICTGKPVFSV
jgi:hypothetical protein